MDPRDHVDAFWGAIRLRGVVRADYAKGCRLFIKSWLGSSLGRRKGLVRRSTVKHDEQPIAEEFST